MTEWRPINTAPGGEARVLIYVPHETPSVFEAKVERDGSFQDPVYFEWTGKGATQWMPMPEPPKPVD